MKKLIVWLLVLCMSLGLTALAEGGNYTDEMKFDDGCDLSPEDGADSVERLGDHEGSPYFSQLDFYNMTSTDTLTILTNFKTLQQSSEWSCGVTSALMTLEWYGLRGDYTEETLARLREGGAEPGPPAFRRWWTYLKALAALNATPPSTPARTSTTSSPSTTFRKPWPPAIPS